MKLADVLALGLANLRQTRLRTMLTMLGVAIGVAALVGMVSLGVGLQESLNARLLKTGFFQTIGVFPQGESRATAQPPRPLDDVALVAIRQIPGVRRVDPDIRIPLRIEVNGKSAGGLAVGLPLEASDEALFREMPAGKFFSAEDAREIILNTEMARNLGFARPADLVGKTVTASVGGRGGRSGPGAGFPGIPALPSALALELRVVGLVERERAIFGSFGSQIYVPFKLAEQQQKAFRERLAIFPPAAAFLSGFQRATVILHSARDLDRVEAAIRGLGFRTISISSAISQLRRVFLIVDLILAFVGSIGLSVACLGIVNTMVMAVLERTREIGVMKAVGAEDGDIRRIFLAESAALGALGGVLGLLLAWALGRAVNAGANIYFARQGFQPENLFQIPLWLLAAAIGFSVAVSIASGLYPAARAARIDPTRALRHD